MKNTVSALCSEYIVDGVRMEETPAQILSECLVSNDFKKDIRTCEPIVDETGDPSPCTFSFSSGQIGRYLQGISGAACKTRNVPAAFSGMFTRFAVAKSLIDTLWNSGHFSIEDINGEIEWEWDLEPVGNLASFYFSAEAAGRYIYDLGIGLSGYSLKETEACRKVSFGNILIRHREPFPGNSEEEFPGGHDKERSRSMSRERICPDKVLHDEKSWLIYIPFDPCPYRLGGSLLHGLFGSNGDTAPEIKDADYFIDCFEVVRELVEDGIVMSGTTVADGGLMTAADRLCRNSGIDIDLKGIESAYSEKDPVRILFSEIPGVIIQIKDSDYDYIDSQFLLQEIAYYPIGHPETGRHGTRVSGKCRPDVMSILSALMQGPYSEGED